MRLRPLLLLGVMAIPSLALAEGVLLHHQGRLLDGGDRPVNGNRDITVSLFPSATGGTATWTETYTVSLFEGFYAISLGSTDNDKKELPAETFEGPLWLGVSIDDVEMLPRGAIGITPYAVEALRAGDAASLGGVLAEDYATREYVDGLLAAPLTVVAPTEAGHATNKEYVDNALADISPEGFARLDGAAFIGTVLVPEPAVPLAAATKQYVDDAISGATPAGFARLEGADFTGPVTVPAPSAANNPATKAYVDAIAGAGGSDPKVIVSDPRLRDAQKITHLKIALDPAGTGDPNARILIDGQNPLNSSAASNGLYLLVLDRNTHQVVTTDTRWNNNYDVNGANGANVAVTLQVALADTTDDHIVILAGKGPVHANFNTFASELLKRGGVPMSRHVFGGNDLYLFVGRSGLEVTDAAEIIRDTRRGATSAELLLVDGHIVAGPALHRKNRIVDYISSSVTRTLSNTSESTYSLDNNLGPFTVVSRGEPIRVQLKAQARNYAYRTSSVPLEYAYGYLDFVVNSGSTTGCAWSQAIEYEGTGARVINDASLACDFTLRLAPGMHTLKFNYRTRGYQNVLYGGSNYSNVVIEEIAE